jgi:DNA-binding beta-propeller fold protein YncE
MLDGAIEPARTTKTADNERKPRRVRVWLYLAVTAMAAAVGGARLWWTWTPAEPHPLGPNWTATTTVLAGDGRVGLKDGPAGDSRFSDPFGVAIAPDGTVYVSDAGDAPAIRAISRDGSVRTIAGSTRGFADGEGPAARFDTPSAIAIDAHGTLFVADTGNNAIRRIDPNGVVTTVAGDTVRGYRDGPGPSARFDGPVGVAIDRDGRIIVADTYNDRIRVVETEGMVRTLAGGDPGFADGPGESARFQTPCAVAVDASGTIHVADTGNGTLRVIDRMGRVTTPAIEEAAIAPIGIAVGPDGSRYVTDERGRVLELSAAGGLRVLAGSTSGFRDGDGIAAQFRSPAGIALAAPGRLIVADAGNALVREMGARDRLEFRPPAPPLIAPRFDVDDFALTPLLWPIAPMEGPFEVAGTSGEARGTAGAERFHAGIDVRASEGTLVAAVRDGTVASAIAANGFGTLTESVRIGPVAYVHIRVGRSKAGAPFPDDRFAPVYDAGHTLVAMRVKRGARFTAGDVIGSVNAFNHVHLNVGWPGEELNPLAFRLVRFEDHVPPTIAGIRLLDEEGHAITERKRRRIIVRGRVQIVVDAWDTADGNTRGRRLGVYALGYQIIGAGGKPVAGFEEPRETLRFDRMAADPATVRTVYAPGSGIPFYGQRRTRFLYIVSNTFRDGIAAPGTWDTTALAPGDYVLRIRAADINGNVATRNRDLPVTVAR